MRYHCEECRAQRQTPFCQVEPSQWAVLLNTCTRHQFKAGQTVFYEGMPASLIYVLCSGQVTLSYTTPQKATCCLSLLSAHLHPYKILDIPALGMSHHSVTCKTLTDAQIACLDKTSFTNLVQHDHHFALLVLNALLTHIASFHDILRDRSGTARQRIAKLLLTFSEIQDQERGPQTTKGSSLSLSSATRVS